MRIIRSIVTVGGFTVISRIFGFLRDVSLASFLGTGAIADAFFLAFKLPNLFRKLFAEGAFNSALVPTFSRILEEDGKDAALKFAQSIFTYLILFLSAATLGFELYTAEILDFIFPALKDNPDRFEATVTFARITFPFLLLIAMTAFQCGVLNAVGKFAVPAAMPIVLNLCIILAILIYGTRYPTYGHAAAYGVLVAGLLQYLLVSLSAIKNEVFVTPVRLNINNNVKRFFALLLPAIVGSGLFQIIEFIGEIIATYLPVGSISYLFYAGRVVGLPLALTAISIGTVILPALSRARAAHDEHNLSFLQNKSIELILLICLPASAALTVLADPIIFTLFKRDSFTELDAILTAAALKVNAFSLIGYSLVRIFSSMFHAAQNTKTPVVISTIYMIINIILCIIFMRPLLHVGIMLAAAITGFLSAFTMGYFLRRDGILQIEPRLVTNALKFASVSVVMGIVLYLATPFATPYIYAESTLLRALGLGTLIALGLGTYGIGLLVVGVSTPKAIMNILKRA